MVHGSTPRASARPRRPLPDLRVRTGTRRPPGQYNTGMDSVIEALKRDVDRTLLRENLRLTPEERVLELMALLRAAEEFRQAGIRARERP